MTGEAAVEAGTFLSLVAHKACEALGAEAVDVIVLAQQARPTIQALAGVTEVTCKGSPNMVIW